VSLGLAIKNNTNAIALHRIFSLPRFYSDKRVSIPNLAHSLWPTNHSQTKKLLSSLISIIQSYISTQILNARPSELVFEGNTSVLLALALEKYSSTSLPSHHVYIIPCLHLHRPWQASVLPSSLFCRLCEAFYPLALEAYRHQLEWV
jgi:hypothetical protein